MNMAPGYGQITNASYKIQGVHETHMVYMY